MDEKMEKDLAILAMKVAGLDNRCQLVLAMADLVNEYHMLAGAQQKIIKVLTERLNAYEAKSVNPVGESVQGTSPTPP